jgi:glycosyltransferase involved in cell wall biosynthesis
MMNKLVVIDLFNYFVDKNTEREQFSKQSKMKLTIITITYNAENYIEQTLKSIQKQDCHDFEYLIIDGKSKDKTLEIAQKYDSIITKIISEPDKGLYDAMNKGLKNATGEFVWFMNAGDEIVKENAVSRILDLIKPNVGVIYGETYFVNEEGEIQGIRSELTTHQLPQNLTWRSMKYGMVVCHQSFIARRTIAPMYMIDNLSADLDWEIEVLKKSEMNVLVDFILSKYLIGGISNRQLKKSLKDRNKVFKKHFGLLEYYWINVVILLRGIFKIIIKRGKYW